MNKSIHYSTSLKWSFALLLSASLVACGGGGRDPILGSDGGAGGSIDVVAPPAGSVLLGSASGYGVFGGSAGMTNTGIQTVITGTNGATADIGTIATNTSPSPDSMTLMATFIRKRVQT